MLGQSAIEEFADRTAQSSEAAQGRCDDPACQRPIALRQRIESVASFQLFIKGSAPIQNSFEEFNRDLPRCKAGRLMR